ncbi:MAG: uroporphyrinogen-III C-methyltransferase [Gammaproteobacteria bacterium]|nr:uroporphyrinogen-III C-methyltransferase [Gammaproteobacteria bacterium]
MSLQSPAAGPAASAGEGNPVPAPTTANAGARPAGAPGAPRPGRVAGSAVALALLATAAAGALWWQQRELEGALQSADAELGTEVARLRDRERSVAERVAGLEAALTAERARSDELAQLLRELPRRVTDAERALDPLPTRLADVESRLDALQGGGTDARDEWLRAEAQYYLTVANAELALAGRWSTAAKALELADARLAALSDPAVAPVRERIADELLALGSVDRPDIDGVVLTLGRLAARAEELPLRAAAPERYEQPAEPVETAEPGFSRLWESVRGALGGIVSIERSDERPPPLSPERQALASRELALELQLARVAALRGRGDAFGVSLRAARALLQRDFDTGAAAVRNALDVLDGMLDIDVAPPRPDISGSLNLLRGMPAGGG